MIANMNRKAIVKDILGARRLHPRRDSQFCFNMEGLCFDLSKYYLTQKLSNKEGLCFDLSTPCADSEE
jgi:hypothetical protein